MVRKSTANFIMVTGKLAVNGGKTLITVSSNYACDHIDHMISDRRGIWQF